MEVSEIRAGGTGLLITSLGERAPEEAGRPRPAAVSGTGASHHLRTVLIGSPFPSVARVQTGVGTVSGLMFPFWADPSPLQS